jgi:excinuclease ABC subunit A
VQRINLTTALGTSLVNTLFVLDEPSIGLHPRDMHRIIEAMQRLRDAGNTLVVVEHDPAVMLAADRMIDMGPGPGERGGQIVFDGTTQDLRQADTLTGAYLGGRKQVGQGFRRLVAENTPRLVLEGVREHNLRNVSVEIPLQRLVCVTGVSGSGKSTLVQDVLAPALMRHFGRSTDAPGSTTACWVPSCWPMWCLSTSRRSARRPAPTRSVMSGAWDAIREIFANARAVAPARLHRGQVQLQQRRWPLPDLRRIGLRACRDAVPQRRLPALPGLRRQALPPRGPRGAHRAALRRVGGGVSPPMRRQLIRHPPRLDT